MTEPTPDTAPQVMEAEPTPTTDGTVTTETADVTMSDPTEIAINPEVREHTFLILRSLILLQQQPQTASLPESQPAPTPTPVSAATPTPAPVAPASSRNSPHPSASQQAPTQPIPHGSPTRVYLNQHVTPYLLEAMKHLATNEPEKPLKFLSDFLATKSAEIEG